MRDTFAAVFFFAFGLTIDPSAVADVAVPILAAVVITIGMCAAAGVVTARIYGFGRRAAANISTMVVARGEFSLILASLAATAGLDDRIGSFVAGYVFVLALGAPLLAANSRTLSRLIPARALSAGGPT
jgi:CPA2 family monovalent cation:H+ antiporter-2